MTGSGTPLILLVLAIALLLLPAPVTGRGVTQTPPDNDTCSTKDNNNDKNEPNYSLSEDDPNTGDLIIGYSLLAHTLDAESQLRYLHWLREATFRSPSPRLETLMTGIYRTARRRGGELRHLRTLAPNMTAPKPPTPIGDAIQIAAEKAGTREMLFPDGMFGMRFVFLQAQATRMVGAMASSIARIDVNVERVRWLKDLAEEFHELREQLVKAVEGCKL